MSDADQIVRALFRTAAGRDDPYPLYHALRTVAPVHRSVDVRAWVLTRYADCNSLLRDPRLEQAYAAGLDRRRPDWRAHAGYTIGERWMLNIDGPEHARLRHRVAAAFSPRAVERLREQVAGVVDDLLGAYVAGGGGDLVAGVAYPLPTRVIAGLLGVQWEGLAPAAGWVRALTVVFEPGPDPTSVEAGDDGASRLQSYAAGAVGDARRGAGAGLLAELAADDRLTDAELTSLTSLLIVGGFETTTHLIANGVRALLDAPDQVAALRDRPELCAGAADELLRHDGPIQFITRTAAAPILLEGATIGAGETVALMLGAANRDPARYADPDRLDVTRTDVRPLGFGGGAHYCLGAALARLEVEQFLRGMLERCPQLAAAGPAYGLDRLALRGASRLPLTV